MLSSCDWMLIEVLVAVAVIVIGIVNMPDSWLNYIDEKGVL